MPEWSRTRGVLNAGDPFKRNTANMTTTTLFLLASKICVCVLVALFLKGAPAFRTDLFLERREGPDSGVS